MLGLESSVMGGAVCFGRITDKGAVPLKDLAVFGSIAARIYCEPAGAFKRTPSRAAVSGRLEYWDNESMYLMKLKG
jgi:hypothetical protein